ncbi:5'-3' exonuclease H3TH domain-containing protein [Wenzhouxiangella limi]|uniref:5'-3' exonuclease H3TH domain-containing protein n=1 Tax=Wenzhouxiangella limi TaxID=2707351 RepID=UPI0019404CC8
MNPVPESRPVYLVDASVYIFRAWFSMPDQFADSAGRPTNAVYGFARFLCELLEQTRGTHIAVAFDESLTSSFRNEIYPAYKANREPAPEALRQQFAWCKDLARHAGLPVYADDRFEADDLIACLAGHCRTQQRTFCVVSGDKDLAQLIGERDSWWDFARRRRLDQAGVLAHFGVRPDQIADFLALTGDPVDNIPGVPGIGPKTAGALLAHFGTLDQLFERLDEIPFLKLRGARTLPAKLKAHEAEARLALRLTRLADDVEQLRDAPRIQRDGGNEDALDALLDGLGFGRPLRERLHRQRATASIPEA